MLQSSSIVSELRLQSELLGQSTASLDSGSSTQRRAGARARASMASHCLGAPAKVANISGAKAEVNIMYVVMIVCVCLLPSSEPKSYHGSIALV